MIKILIAVIVVIIMFLVNKMCMKKNKYFFPIIPFIISCVIIGISIFQIVQKENEYAADEIQPVAIEESGFESRFFYKCWEWFLSMIKKYLHIKACLQ